MRGRRNVENAVAQLGGEAVHACDAWQEVRRLGRRVDCDAPADVAVEDDAVSAEPRRRLQDFCDLCVVEVQGGRGGRGGGGESCDGKRKYAMPQENRKFCHRENLLESKELS